MNESIESQAILEPHIVTPEDWEKLSDLRLRAVTENPQAFAYTRAATEARDKAEWVDSIKRATTYVIKSGESYVAAATFKQDTDGVWMINGVWTDPAFRGQGLSKKLFEQIFHDAKAAGITIIELGVNPVLEDAVALYTTLGFKVVNQNQNQMMGDGQEYSQDVMRIDLTEVT